MKRPIFNRESILQQMIRVDHAGEYGATMIYQGQLYSEFGAETREEIELMQRQELEHLKFFEKKMRSTNTRPTILIPFWHYLGLGLGYISSLFAARGAMICTDSVEDVISSHYEGQIKLLSSMELKNSKYNDLEKKFIEFRQEELDHKSSASSHIGEYNFLEKVASGIIKSICKAAIFISRKI